MASAPTYNPNQIESANGYASIIKSPNACPGSSSALYNRATEGLYPPGSTFKTVTAAAALDDHVYTPESGFYDPGYCTEYGVQVHNALDQSGPEQYGNVDMIQAYEHSINAVFCNIGMKLGATRIIDEAKKFGFYSKPPIELPSDTVSPSGEFDFKTSSFFTDPNRIDPGRTAFGQDKLLATPLQMALVAAAVANGGTIMEPHLVEEGDEPDRRHGRERQAAGVEARDVAADGCRPEHDDAGRRHGRHRRRGPDRRASRSPARRAPRRRREPNVYDAWFIFFAPADHPTVAGAVVVEHSVNGFGGAVAAPIAKQLMEAILPPASKG